MLFADHDLARRIEAGEARVGWEWTQAHARLLPNGGSAAEMIAGGCAAFGGVDSPVTQAQGLGMNGPVGETELDQLESFYRTRGSNCKLILCPLADPSLLQRLAPRGYRLTELENVLALRLDRFGPPMPAASDVQVRQARPDEVELWARTMASGFLEYQGALFGGRASEKGVDPKSLEMLVAGFHTAGTACFLAFLGGEPAGGGAISVHEGVAMLNGASTLPAFRNRGVHTTLHHVRLKFALDAACDLARVVTQPGSGSQRNAERKGFQVVYTRAAMVREFAEPR